MLLFKKVSDLQTYLTHARISGKTISFVPTMGALHEGHLSLVRLAKKETGLCVCSIFVNPTQFNDPKDLEKYPRTPVADIALLNDAACDVLFMPPVEEVYPPGLDVSLALDFNGLDLPMEGAHRPGHFAGMAKVVKRLLDLVQPERLYMGQKDFQQFSIVRHLIDRLEMPIEIVCCPTLREPDGLAMSSRNVRLTPEQRTLAPLIYRTLQEAKAKFATLPPRQIEAEALASLRVPGMMSPEYFEIVDGKTLRPVEAYDSVEFVVACTAARVGEIRLIDNIIFKND